MVCVCMYTMDPRVVFRSHPVADPRAPVIANEGVDVTCFDAPINWHIVRARINSIVSHFSPLISTFQYYKCSHLLHCLFF